MKSIVVYYSRTGTTKKVAEEISKLLKCDSEQILDIKSRQGSLGYLRSGKESATEKIAEIKKTKKNPCLYDIVIIGTPIWAWNMSSPVRTYISKNKNHFKNVAFFCTMGSSGGIRAFKKMEILSGKKPLAVLEVVTKEVASGKYFLNVKKFVDQVISKK